MASEWQQRLQAMQAKRTGEESQDKGATQASTGTFDFRSALKKPIGADSGQNIKGSTQGNINSPPTNNSVPAWKQRFGGGAAPSTAPSNANKNLPAWKQRLEAQKQGGPVVKSTGGAPARAPLESLPTEVKAMRERFQEEFDMRKKSQNKLQLVLAKIEESKKLFMKALEILNDAEVIAQLELKDQQGYDSVSQLPPDEQEKVKEEEWKQWIEDIEKRKKTELEQEVEIDQKEKEERQRRKEEREKRKAEKEKRKKEKEEKKKSKKDKKSSSSKSVDKSEKKEEASVAPKSNDIRKKFEEESKKAQEKPLRDSKNNEEKKKEEPKPKVTPSVATTFITSSVSNESTAQTPAANDGQEQPKQESVEEPKRMNNIRSMFEQKSKEEQAAKHDDDDEDEDDEEGEEDSEEEAESEEEEESSEEEVEQKKDEDETVLDF